MTLLVALQLVAVLALYDRGCGWKINGVKRIAFTVGLGCVFWLILGRLGSASPIDCALLALGCYASRSPPWRTFGGDLAPRRDQFEESIARHLLALAIAPGLVACQDAWLSPAAWGWAVTSLAGYGIVAALLGRLNRMLEHHRINAYVELARGAALGAAIAIHTSLKFPVHT